MSSKDNEERQAAIARHSISLGSLCDDLESGKFHVEDFDDDGINLVRRLSARLDTPTPEGPRSPSPFTVYDPEGSRLNFDFGFGVGHTVFRNDWEAMAENAGNGRTKHLMQKIDGITRLIHSFEGNESGHIESLRIRDRLNGNWPEESAPYVVIDHEQFERDATRERRDPSPEPGM